MTRVNFLSDVAAKYSDLVLEQDNSSENGLSKDDAILDMCESWELKYVCEYTHDTVHHS